MTKPEYDKKHFIDEGTNEFISNANLEDETRVKTALYVTSFQSSSSYYPMYDLLNDTFKNFTLDIELTDSNSTLGYYEYNVTVSGDYYANTADKNSGITSSGDMEFVIVYIDNELNTCTVAVKDIWGDVYQAMANILFNL